MIPTCCARLGTLAVGLVLSGPAFSGEWELGLGAEFEPYFGYVSYDSATATGFDGADAVAGARLFLRTSTVVSNDLKFGANIQIEGHLGERNAGVKLDEAALFMVGPFGEFWLGRSDTPGNHMQFGAPDSFGPDVNLTGPSTAILPSFLQFSNIHNNVRVGDDLLRASLGSTFVSNTGEDNATRLSYFSPRMGGFQLGVSYAPDGPGSAFARQDFVDLGLNYTREFNGIEAALSAKWGVADNPAASATPDYWGLGVQLGYRGLTLGGSYAETSGSAFGATDGRAYDVGASYETGRYGFSIHYLSGRNTDDENALLGGRETLEAVTLAARYKLRAPGGDRPIAPPRPGETATGSYGNQDGAGAEIFGFMSFADFDEEMGDGGNGTAGDDMDGFVVGTGFRLTF